MKIASKKRKAIVPKVIKKSVAAKQKVKRKSKSTPASKTITKKTTTAKKAAEKNYAASYNAFKEYNGEYYTGMKVGRSHKWYYDKGVWKETKMTPDLWKIDFTVTKRRAGKAPEGSGVPVGTEYNWYILAHQLVKKLNANDYSTSLTGLKYKLAHRRADKDKWSITDKGQKKRAIKILQQMIDQLNKELTEQ
jgi:hypothetical protein